MTNKANVFYIDDTWSSDISSLQDYGSENISGYK